MTVREPAWKELWAEAKDADMLAVAKRLGAKLKCAGPDWIGPCPAGCAEKDGFVITPSKAIFLCRPSGATGDAVEMVQHVRGGDKLDALEFISGKRAAQSRPARAARTKEQQNEEAIEAVLKRAKPFDETHARAYLAARAGAAPARRLTADLKFVANLDYWNDDNPRRKIATLPAMVAIIRDVAGKIIGIHQTYLDPDEPRKWTPPDGLPAKKIRGHVKGGLIRLGPIGNKLAIGEGIETTLRWYLRALGPEDVSIACGVSLDNIAGGSTGTLPHPTAKLNGKPARFPNGEPHMGKPGIVLPEGVHELILLGDGDSEPLATQGKIASATRRHLRDGLTVSVHFAPDGKDWADDVGDDLPPIEDGQAFLERIAPFFPATPQPAPPALNDNGGTPADGDEAEIERLAKLPLIKYERERKGAAEALNLRASMLDRVIAAKRAELGIGGGDGKQGRAVEFPDPELWLSPVDGVALLAAIAGALALHVVMTEHQRVAGALWIVHTYLIDRFMISPRLAVRSATKGSGKTTLLDVLARMVLRPLPAAGVSPSVVFRVIEKHAPTFLIDEADGVFRDHDQGGSGDDLRRILNSGHRRGWNVMRAVGDDFEPRAFACFGAVAIALIGQLPNTLIDRSIDIVLARRRPSEPIEAFRFDRTERLDLLARQIARWAKDNAERIGQDDPVMPPGLHNRAADNWRPLLAIAEAVGGGWPQKARQAVAALAGADPDEVALTELLLSDIRDIFAGSKDDELIPSTPLVEIASATLVERLIEIVPRPWAEYGKSGKPITQNKLARLLKPVGIGPGFIGPEKNRLRGYRREQFDDAFERYLAPLSPLSNRASVQPPKKSSTYAGDATVQAENGCTVASSAKSFSHNEMHGCTVGKGGTGEESASHATGAAAPTSDPISPISENTANRVEAAERLGQGTVAGQAVSDLPKPAKRIIEL